jgi:hypothetical protein
MMATADLTEGAEKVSSRVTVKHCISSLFYARRRPQPKPNVQLPVAGRAGAGGSSVAEGDDDGFRVTGVVAEIRLTVFPHVQVFHRA